MRNIREARMREMVAHHPAIGYSIKNDPSYEGPVGNEADFGMRTATRSSQKL